MAQVGKGVCMICAVQLWEWSPKYSPQKNAPSTADFNPYKWREAHILIFGPTWPNDEKGPTSMKIPDESVIIQNGQAYNRGQVTLSNGLEVSLQLEGLPDQHPDHDPDGGHRWYLGFHSACVDVARQAMNAPSSKIRSIGDIWMTIERRCVKTNDDDGLIPLYLPKLPDSRPGEPLVLGLRRYYIHRHAICTEEPILDGDSVEWWDYDPLDIPHLTKALVSNLERAEASSTHEGFTNNFNNLPREIEDSITSLLSDGRASLECTYLIPQSHWKEAFFRIPFLWDIEKDVVEAKSKEAIARAFEWNWERLVRQLMSEVTVPETEITDPCDAGYNEAAKGWSYEKVGLNVPPGLTNRRRIWQILIDMYPNDVGMEHVLDSIEEDDEEEVARDKE